jgi:hypothetical protein
LDCGALSNTLISYPHCYTGYSDVPCSIPQSNPALECYQALSYCTEQEVCQELMCMVFGGTDATCGIFSVSSGNYGPGTTNCVLQTRYDACNFESIIERMSRCGITFIVEKNQTGDVAACGYNIDGGIGGCNLFTVITVQCIPNSPQPCP